ncbi:DUF6163 family protein [Enterovirga rhinocerotis]|uniref:DoxX-like protein n=1 Tax=Enterovirga rhinocerotis TaxID=1339210 RepID=A0A4R7CCN3_9HYPH|nr:DUF6163 family protein [Enterovirga rhinocerotis]TDR94577.1 hypothetical protein EV668_1865 [Enterovirga rhinocerotis]
MIGLLRRGSAAQGERPDDIIVDLPDEERPRWNRILVWFMRGLSLAWLVKGLAAWGMILGVKTGFAPFEGSSTGYQACIVYFAVIDIVAAIGLWLTSTWGGVLWLLAVMSHLIIAVFFPRFVSDSTLLIALFIVAIMMYLTISWLASVEE